LDLRGCYVDVQADNVTLRDCLLDSAAGYFGVRQYGGYSGLTVEYVTVDGQRAASGAGTAVLSDSGTLAVRDSIFTGLPADAVNLPAGSVTRCRISSLGWASGAHADGIVIPKQTSRIDILDNDLDGAADGAPAGANHLVQVCPSAGPITMGILIATNRVIGGTYSLAVYGAGGVYPISGVEVRGNVLGGGLYGDIYPTTRPADLVIADNVRLGTGLPISA
jgi:hypothetical protein